MKKIIALLICFTLILTLTIHSNYSFAEEQKTKITINSQGVNIRSGPSTSDSIIKTANRGEMYEQISTEGDWLKIVLTNNEFGYVSKQFANELNSNDEQKSTTGIVRATILNVRSTPSDQADIIGKLAGNEEVTIINSQNGWYEIIFKQRTGWVSDEFIQKLISDEPEEIIEVPQHLNGLIGTVTASSLKVRKKNNYKAKIVAEVTKNSHFEIIEEKDNWAKIEYKKGKSGWLPSWFLQKQLITNDDEQTLVKVKNSHAVIKYDETPLRKSADPNSPIVRLTNEGDKLEIIHTFGDWYEVKIEKKTTAFVAGWLVTTTGSVTEIVKNGPEQYLTNKTIVLDPGHGGNDQGTEGALGTIEKQLTLKTAHNVAKKLRDAGANVILTREKDEYVSLDSRVQVSNYDTHVDAFISIHFDSLENDNSVKGMTTYYYYNFQKKLAANLHSELVAATKLKNRGTQYGDYYVLRENQHNSVLLELGYLNNPTEESYVTTNHFQNAVAEGVYRGLAQYFKNN